MAPRWVCTYSAVAGLGGLRGFLISLVISRNDPQVAEIMGKLGGRSRQWLLEGLSNEYKPIPEYGLRVILAFSPRTSFLVPLDRCIQFAAAAIKQGRNEAGSQAWLRPFAIT